MHKGLLDKKIIALWRLSYFMQMFYFAGLKRLGQCLPGRDQTLKQDFRMKLVLKTAIVNRVNVFPVATNPAICETFVKFAL